MDTINLPKGIDGSVIKPNSDVYIAFTGDMIHVDGFVFWENGSEFMGSPVKDIIYYKSDGSGHNTIPVVFIASTEPTEDEKKDYLLAFAKANIMVGIAELVADSVKR